MKDNKARFHYPFHTNFLLQAVEKVVIDTREDEEDEDLESMYSYSSRQTSATNFSTGTFMVYQFHGLHCLLQNYTCFIYDAEFYGSLKIEVMKYKFIEFHRFIFCKFLCYELQEM